MTSLSATARQTPRSVAVSEWVGHSSAEFTWRVYSYAMASLGASDEEVGPAGTAVAAVLFDLDGTLSDSAPGILSALRYAFAQNGVTQLGAEHERVLLGPPFYQSLPPIVGADRLDAVIASYREFYGSTGMFDTVAYDGVAEVLAWLRERGVRLAVATSKPEHYAVPIVEHLGFSDDFVTICGDTLDGARGSKALVVGEALTRLDNPDPSEVLMVGDREHDVLGARAHGIACIGAGWGYGGPDELAAAGAIAEFGTPGELLAALPALMSERNDAA